MRKFPVPAVWSPLLWNLAVWTSLALLNQPSAHAAHQPTQPIVNFELYNDYLIVVRGSAGPLKDLNFLLDTGTSPTILSRHVAQRLHLDPTPAVVAAVGGNVQGEMSTVPSLVFGPIRRENFPVLIRDLTAVQPILPIQIDGIVGIDVLGQSSFLIDYNARTIRFGLTPTLPASIPLQLEDGLPIVDATINHTPAHLVLDTGAAALVLFATPPPARRNENSVILSAAHRAQSKDPDDANLTPTARNRSIPEPFAPANPDALTQAANPPRLVRTALPKSLGHVEHKPIRLDRFQLGPSNFGREPAFLVLNPDDDGHHYDGLLSPTALGITQVAIDLTNHTLAFARTP